MTRVALMDDVTSRFLRDLRARAALTPLASTRIGREEGMLEAKMIQWRRLAAALQLDEVLLSFFVGDEPAYEGALRAEVRRGSHSMGFFLTPERKSEWGYIEDIEHVIMLGAEGIDQMVGTPMELIPRTQALPADVDVAALLQELEFFEWGCLSGDCPHGHANECLAAIRQQASDMGERVNAFVQHGPGETRAQLEQRVRDAEGAFEEQKRMIRDGALLLRHLVDDTRHEATSLDDESERIERVSAWCAQADDYLALFPEPKPGPSPDDD